MTGFTNNQAVVLDAGVVAPPRRPPTHLDFLDGIRGLAAFYVMIRHVWIGHAATYRQSGLRGALPNWLLYGRLAVDVFIVLAGFCLVIPIARDLRL